MSSINQSGIDLLDLVTRNQTGTFCWQARTKGGEWAGPCPFCGGNDRFRVWPKAGAPHWWCRACATGGDAIAFVRKLRGCTFRAACDELGIKLESDATESQSSTASTDAGTPDTGRAIPPPDSWQDQAARVVEQARSTLWSDEGAGARQWLHDRGLTDAIISEAGLGFIPVKQWQPARDWGLEREGSIQLHRGILFPWFGEDASTIWRLAIRRPVTGDMWAINHTVDVPTFASQSVEQQLWRALQTLSRDDRATIPRLSRASQVDSDTVTAILAQWEEQQLVAHPSKQILIPGGSNGLYRCETLVPGKPAILLEGEINVLSVQQAVGDSLGVVGTGASTWARDMRWILKLGCCPIVLVAMDNDEDPAKGERAACYWLDALTPRAYRWRPYLNDPNDMLQAGMNLQAWVEAGLAAVAAARQPPASVSTTLTDAPGNPMTALAHTSGPEGPGTGAAIHVPATDARVPETAANAPDMDASGANAATHMPGTGTPGANGATAATNGRHRSTRTFMLPNSCCFLCSGKSLPGSADRCSSCSTLAQN